MSILATASITLVVTVDVASVDIYYKLQSSTANPPQKPETASPSGWTTTEPIYDGTSTNTLYTCQKTTLTDGTFYWSAVSKSSSYEAAKSAYNLASSTSQAFTSFKQDEFTEVVNAVDEQSTTITNLSTTTSGLVINTKQFDSATGNPVVASDAIEAPLRTLEADGWAEQFTTSGKNLLPMFDNASTQNGITFTPFYEDGLLQYVSLSGTSTARAKSIDMLFSLPNGTYTFSIRNRIANVGAYVRIIKGSSTTYVDLADDSTTDHRTFTVSDPDSLGFLFDVRIAGITLSNLRLYPQIELGSTVTSYEPYTGGAPSPSPDYPQEIQVARGRNLLDESNLNRGNGYIDTNGNIGGNGLMSYGHSDSINLAERAYVLSGIAPMNDNYRVHGYSENDEWIRQLGSTVGQIGSRFFIQFNVTSDIDHIKLSYLVPTADFQLTLGSTPQPYVPYGHVGLEVLGRNLVEAPDAEHITTQTSIARLTLPSGTYVLSATLTNHASIAGYLRLRNVDAPYAEHGAITIPAGTSKQRMYVSCTLSDTATMYITINGNASGYDISVEDVQINKGDELLPYQPYYHTTTPIPLSSTGYAASLPSGTCDELHIDSAGHVEWVQNTLKIDVLVDENTSITTYTYLNTNGVVILSPLPYNATRLGGYCSIYPVSPRYYNQRQGCWLGVGNKAIFMVGILDFMGLETVEEFKAAMLGKTISFLIPTETPITHDMGYISMPQLSEGCSVSIPELDEMGVSWYCAGSSGTAGNSITLAERIKNAETSIVQNADSITLRVSNLEQDVASVGGFKILDSSYTNPVNTILNWAAEGTSRSWTVTSTAGVRVNDTVYIKTVPSDNNSKPLYIIATVTAVSSATALTATSHGYIDYSLTNRMTNAETSITQNANAIELRAIKTEVADTYATKASLAASQPFVLGTQTAATRFWTGVCNELMSLTDGQQITYWLPYSYKNETAQSKGIAASELVPTETITNAYNNDWLKLILADGTDTGWIPCYYGGTTRMTSHYAGSNAIHLTYREGYSSSIPKGWWGDANYDSNSNNYDRRLHNDNVKAIAAVTAAHLIAGTSSGYQQLEALLGFDLSYPILYASAAIAENATNKACYEAMPNINFSTTGTIQSGTANKMLWLKGSVVGTTFTIASSNWLTTVTPSSADQMYYIPLGIMTSATNGYFSTSDKLYAYLDGAFQRVDVSATTRITTAESSITQNATNIELKVSKDGVISSINQSSESVTIDASKVNIAGATLFTSGRLSENSLNSAYDANGAATSALNSAKSYADTKKTEAINSANSSTDTKLASYATKTDAIKRTQRIYYQNNSTTAPSTPGAASSNWVTDTSGSANRWTLKRMSYASATPYIWTCEQKETVSGTVSYTTVLLDDTITVIDGGKIITGSVAANAISATSGTFNTANIPNLSAAKITSGDISADRIKANVISAINSLTAGTIDAARINAANLSIGYSQITNTPTIPSNVSDLNDASNYSTTTQMNTAIDNAVDGIEVGGRNLLRNTASPSSSDICLTRATLNNDSTIRLTPTTSGGSCKWRVDYLNYADYKNETYTISCDARLANVTSSYTDVLFYIYLVVNAATRLDNTVSSSYDAYAGKTFDTVTSDWKRFSITVSVPTDLTSGTSAALVSGSQLTAQFSAGRSTKPIDIRNVKIEKGNKATDWTAAPEDTVKYLTTVNSTGIMVHPSNDSTSGVKVTDVVDIMRSGTSVSQFGETQRIGLANKPHITMGSDSISMYGTLGTNEIFHVSKASNSDVAILSFNGDCAFISLDDSTGSAGITLENVLISSASHRTILHAEGNSIANQTAITVDGDADSIYLTSASYTNGNYNASITIDGLAAEIFFNGTFNASNVNAGTFNAARIPNLAASKINSGTLALARGGTASDNTATAINKVFAGPSSGSAGNASFRSLVAADIPNLAASKINSGTIATARGGTGQSWVAMKAGSTVINLSNGIWAPVVSSADVATYLGSGADGTNTIAIVQNGDFNACDKVISGGISNDGSVRGYLSANHTGSVRFNWLLIRFA